MARVLIVEDQRKHLESLQRGLEAEGYEIVAAATGEEGWQAAQLADRLRLTRCGEMGLQDMIPG